jgi:hypothetical protein
MRRNRIIAFLIGALLGIVVFQGALALYRLAPHPAWCICDVCHEQFDGERGE